MARRFADARVEAPSDTLRSSHPDHPTDERCMWQHGVQPLTAAGGAKPIAASSN